MSYLALARKWRPRTFSQLIGQEHINTALINSLTRQRLHHAYLFTGTRGVGKTSIARLFAKALNCEQGIGAEPCLACETCLAIEQGHFIDLIEIDGASRTRVEDTRELLDNVQYRPTSGRFKIYLIDEVHMLSQHSFNALLKTLEEPPSHVKFLLATTDPQKLPMTILSRCLQFSLKQLPVELISSQLKKILDDEQLAFEVDAINLLAKAAKGSMRDALSLLDQAIASIDNLLSAVKVKSLLGYTQHDYALELLQALADLDAQQLIVLSRQIAQDGGYFRYVLDEILSYLHQIIIFQTLPENALLDIAPDIAALAKKFSAEDIQLFYQIGIKGIDEMALAPSLAVGFEMTLLRMLTFRPASQVTQPPLAYEKKQDTPLSTIKQTLESIPQPEIIVPEKQPDSSQVNQDWASVLKKIKLTGIALNAAENAELAEKSGREIRLRVAMGHRSLFTPTVTKRIEQALTEYYNETIKIALCSDEPVQSSPAIQKQQVELLRQQEAEVSLQQDPFFQQLKQDLAAEVVKNSIVPLKDVL